MSLKVIASLAFLAVCSAALYGANTYYVNVGYGNIVVSNPYGYQVNIVASPLSSYNTPQYIQVQVDVPGVVQPYLQYIDQQVSLGNVYQSDILYQILKGYSGQLDEIAYQKLINVISTYVQNGQINPAILYALEALIYPYGVQTWNQFIQVYSNIQGVYPGQQGLYGLSNVETPYSRLGYLNGLGGRLGGISGFGSYLRNNALGSTYSGFGYGSSYPGYSYGYPRYGYSGYYGPYASSMTPLRMYGGISGYLSQFQGRIPYSRQYNMLPTQALSPLVF